MTGKPIDPKFQRALEFAKHHNEMRGKSGISNLYVIQKKDLDGNVIEEKYGMNLMTDYGMSQYLVSNTNFPTNVYIGNGSGSFNHTTSNIISPITTISATVSSTAKNYSHPLYYDSVAGLATSFVQYLQCYFDYNITDVTVPVTISEYGIGTSPTQLWTHSWVYDNLGNQSTITKELNTRLEITVYFCMSFSTSLITNAWNEGKYVIVTNPARFFDSRMYENGIRSYKRNGVNTTRGTSRTKSLFTNNLITMTTTISPFIIYPNTGNDHDYIDGFINWHSGCMMIDTCKYSTPKAFDTINNPDQSTIGNEYGYADTFGTNGHIPFTRLNITNSYTYNPETQEFDLPDTFVQDSSVWYNDTSMSTTFAILIRYTNNNTVLNAYVFANMSTDNPIVKFNTAAQTVYATDTYWDTSSWEYISDLTNIPLTSRTKRYYISSSNTDPLNPVRQKQQFAFKCSDDATHHSLNVTYGDGYLSNASNPDGGWFVFGNKIYELTGRVTQIYSSSDFNSIQNIAYENILFSYTSSTSILITDMDAATPAAVSYTSANGNRLWQRMFVTHTKSGRVIASDYSSGNAIKIDFRDSSNVTQTLISSCSIAAAIMLTNQYVMISSSATRDVLVKDFDTDTTVSTFSIDSSLNVPTLVFGYRDKVYVTDCSTYMFLCDVTAGTMTRLSSQFNSNMGGSYRQYLKVDAVNGALVIYRSDTADSHYSFLFGYDNPTVFKDCSVMSYPQYYVNYIQHDLVEINGGTIVDIATGANSSNTRRYVLDVGRYLKDNDSTGMINHSSGAGKCLIPYGEYGIIGQHMIPIANMIPHRLVGTTTTIGTTENPIQFSDKQWGVTITNISQWNGKPPGILQ